MIMSEKKRIIRKYYTFILTVFVKNGNSHVDYSTRSASSSSYVFHCGFRRVSQKTIKIKISVACILKYSILFDNLVYL